LSQQDKERAAAQLGVAYYTLSEWRQKRKAYGDYAFVGSGIRRDAPLTENKRRLMKENAELRTSSAHVKLLYGI
jgi:transposase